MNDKMFSPVRNNDGFTNIITLVTVSILVVIGATFVGTVTFEIRNAARKVRRIQTFYLAEAGLNRGIKLVREEDDWSNLFGSPSPPLENKGEPDWYYLYEPNDGVDVNEVVLDSNIPGTYSVRLKNVSADVINLKAIGSIPDPVIQNQSIDRVIKIQLFTSESSGSTVFAWAIFSHDELRIVGNAKTDSYNSDNGLYEDQTPGENGHIGSNSNITLTGNVTIEGNATPGPDCTVSKVGNVTVTGSTDPASEEVVLPPLDISFSASQELTKSGNGTYTLTDGTYYFTDIKFTGNYRLVTNGDVTIYCESLEFTGNSRITVNGTLEFYCTGDFKSTGNGIVNTNRKPEDFTLYCDGEDIKLTGNSDFYGAVYAPNGDITVTGNHDYYGSMVSGKEVKGAGNAKVHYDEDLANVVEVVSIGGDRSVNTRSWYSY